MSYLRLSNETTNSCDYKVKLSSPFNQDNYREIRITSTDYGKSASRIRRYVAYKDAPNSGTSQYVRGVIDDGMSAGRTYTLYAYAQALNGTWYLAGEDTITTLDNSGGKYDYGFKSVEITTEEPYNIGDEIRIAANVKNYKSSAGPDYKVEVRDKNGNLLDRDYENALAGKETDNAYLYPVLEHGHVEDGYIEYTLHIKADESGWRETDDSDNEETIRIKIQSLGDGDDDFSSATKISFGEKITGTIDQDNDQDYYLIDDIPSDCDVFLVMIDYDDVPHDGDYDCDIYVYDDRENLMGKVNGTPAGLTYMKVPTTGSKHYVRVDFDGDFTSKESQKYNLSTMAIPTIRVEQTNNINTAAEIHEGMHFLQNIKGDEKDYYKIIPVADRKLRFVVQADQDTDCFSVKVMDKNKSILASDSGRNPLKVEYDLKAGEQYYIEVAPETKDSFGRALYLMYVEIDGVGGGGLPTNYEKFSLKENESKYNSISGYTAHQYFITFDKDGWTNFYFEKTSGDLIVQMDLYKNSVYHCSGQMLTDSGHMLIATHVEAGVIYRLQITNLSGSGRYFVRCKNSKSEVAKMVENMPLTTLLKVDADKLIPDILDYGQSVSTTVDLPPFGSVTYKGGASTTSPGYRGTFNIDNGASPSLTFSGNTYTFDKEENQKKFGILCKNLAKFLKNNGFSEVRIIFGSIAYNQSTNTIDLGGFEVQDVLELSKTKYIYTSLSYSQSIDLDNLKLQCELAALAVVGIIILAYLPELLAAGAATAELLALGEIALKIAEVFA